MAQRYLRIKGQIESIIALFPYTLDLTENQLLKDAVVHFEVFQMITVEIQAKGMDLVHCRKQFEERTACIVCLLSRVVLIPFLLLE